MTKKGRFESDSFLGKLQMTLSFWHRHFVLQENREELRRRRIAKKKFFAEQSKKSA